MKKTMEKETAHRYEEPEITDIPSLSKGLVLYGVGTPPTGNEDGGDNTEPGDD